MVKLSPEISNILGPNPFDTLMKMQGDIYRQQGNRETVRITLGNTAYFIKRYHRDCLRPGAKHEWEGLLACEMLHVAVPALKGYGAKGRQSFVLMEALEDASSLEHARPAWLDKCRIIAQIADIARTLHSEGFFHRDFYLCHFFWNPTMKRVSVIDLHRLFKPVLFKQHYLVKDLSSLFFSCFDEGLTQRDVFRFLKQYFKKPLREVLNDHGALLKACETKAIALYQKVNLHSPQHLGWFMHQTYWPDKVGPFHRVFELQGKRFESDDCLRVLPGRRMVLSGVYEGQRAVLKWFAHERDYKREMSGVDRLYQGSLAIPVLEKGNYFYLMPWISGHAVDVMNEALLTTLAALHNQGLIHSDPHMNNFLVDESGRIRILDPGAIKSAQDESDKWENLALCYAQWPSCLDAAHLTLLPIYVQARGLVWSNTMSVNLMKRVKKARAYRLKKWMSKIGRNATEFYAKSRPSVLIHAKRSFVSLNTQSLMQDPEQYFNDEGKYLKQGQSNTVVKVELPPFKQAARDEHEMDITIKRYNLKSTLHFLKNIFRGSKANRAWRNAHLAQFMGIKTPEPLMMIEKRVCYIPSTSYFVSKFVEGESLFQINFNHVSPEEVEAMAAQIAHYLNILKLSQCYHGDLKGSNWIWNGHDMYLMDLDSFRYIPNPAVFSKYHEADLKRFMYNFDEAHVLKKALLILK